MEQCADWILQGVMCKAIGVFGRRTVWVGAKQVVEGGRGSQID